MRAWFDFWSIRFFSLCSPTVTSAFSFFLSLRSARFGTLFPLFLCLSFIDTKGEPGMLPRCRAGSQKKEAREK